MVTLTGFGKRSPRLTLQSKRPKGTCRSWREPKAAGISHALTKPHIPWWSANTGFSFAAKRREWQRTPVTMVSGNTGPRLDIIKTFRDRITFVEGDGVQLIESLSRAKQCFFFLDPPYTAGSISAGARMYEHLEVDHARLFSVAKRMAGEFLMSYDDTPEIRLMARAHGFKVRTVEMRTRHHVAAQELLICRDFDWFSKKNR